MLRKFRLGKTDLPEHSGEFLAGKRRRVFQRLVGSRMRISIVLLTVLSILMVYTLFFSNVFTLKIVKLIPEQVSCASFEQVKTLVPRGKNLLFVKSAELAIILKSKIPCLGDVSIRKQFPDTLVVFVSERKIAAIIKSGVREQEIIEVATPEATDSSQSAKPKKVTDHFKIDEAVFTKSFGVDQDGVLLQENPENKDNLPIFYYLSEREVNVHETIEKYRVENGIVFLSQLKEQGVEVLQAKIEGDSLFIIGPQRVVFLLKKDVTRQVISLQLILQKAKIDSATVEKIDLRFDKPVVVYSKKK